MSPVTSIQPMGVQVALQAEAQKAQIGLIKAQTNSIKADTMKKVTADMPYRDWETKVAKSTTAKQSRKFRT